MNTVSDGFSLIVINFAFIFSFSTTPGSNHMYYFVNPLNKEKSEGTPDRVDWEFAQKEIAHAKGFATGFGAGLSKGEQNFCSVAKLRGVRKMVERELLEF